MYLWQEHKKCYVYAEKKQFFLPTGEKLRAAALAGACGSRGLLPLT